MPLTFDACSWWHMRLVYSATCYKRLLTAVFIFFTNILKIIVFLFGSTEISRIFVSAIKQITI